MCLIIQKPAGRRISADFLTHAWQRNDHGWGMFHPAPGGPAWRKGMTLDELLACNDCLAIETEAYLHLRQATYGPVHAEMAHPHVVRDGLLLMHNGSIHHLAPRDPAVSDSAELATALRDLLAGLDAEQAAALLRSEGFRRLTAPLIQGSMVVLIDAQGAVRLGRDWHRVRQGEWHRDMQGVNVSNVHAWTPLSMGLWQQALRAARRRWGQGRMPSAASLRAWGS
jgi:hypothetical protein